MMRFVSRMVALVVATVIAIWLPMRHANVADWGCSSSTTDSTTQTERPSPTPGVVLLSVAGPARTSVAGHIHEVLAPASLGLLRGYGPSISPPPAALRLASSPPFRTFPLLI